MIAPPFLLLGPASPATPVVIAVGHAGRFYPDALRQGSRLPVERLAALEDRHADALIGDAVAAGATAVVGTVARAWIDLNRDPAEVDRDMIVPPPPVALAGGGPRVRAGLGLVPRRVAGAGEIWRARITAADLAERIATVHAPYHAAIATALAAAHARHGIAILLDCHSMPPLAGEHRGVAAVVGDLAGRSAAPSFAAIAMRACQAAGLRTLHNRPYAGGHTVARHGDPGAGVHAIQLEICRTRYLDGGLRVPGPGLAAMRTLLADMVAGLAATAMPDILAAE